MAKELKVKLKSEENDNYVELWSIIGQKKKYIGRYSYPGSEHWVYVCDPLGYCEIDGPLEEDAVVIVCDKKGNELFRTSNGDGTAKFNTLERESHEQMAKYMRENHPPVRVENTEANYYAHWATGQPQGAKNKWLLSFQDPDLYPQADDYPDNWIMRADQCGDPQILATFTYLGEERNIERIPIHHTICGAEWYEWYSGGYYIGAEFDATKTGTMYTKGQATSILMAAIKEMHPGCPVVFGTHEFQFFKETKYQSIKYSVQEAAESLMRNSKNRFDLHREFIDRMAAEERDKSHFYSTLVELRIDHPDVLT